jgi:HEPN domain-containing protein
MRLEAEPWWEQAEADLETAQLNLELSRWYVVAYFAQQAVEKGLKALYVEERSVLPPRTHHLDELGMEVGVPPAFELDLDLLEPMVVTSRYPDTTGGAAPVKVFSEAAATQALQAAERVIVWVRGQLKM